MKFKFTLFVYFISILISCKSRPSKEKLIENLKEQAFLFHKPIIISQNRNDSGLKIKKNQSQNPTTAINEIDFYIPVEKITSKNIEIEDNHISIILPSPQFKINDSFSEKFILGFALDNNQKFEEIRNELQIFASERISSLMKAHNFRNIKIKFSTNK